MKREFVLRVAWPATILVALSVAYVFRDAYVPTWFAESDRHLLRNLLMAGGWYSAALLLARMIGAALQHRNNGKRRAPKLLGELIVAACFLAATMGTVAMWLGQSAGSALASSGLIIAIVGLRSAIFSPTCLAGSRLDWKRRSASETGWKLTARSEGG